MMRMADVTMGGTVAGKMAFVDAIKAEHLVQLYRYWAARRGDDGFVWRESIDPLDLPASVAPHIILLDVLDGGKNFEYRLVGAAVVKSVGREFVGQNIYEYHREHERLHVALGYQDVVRTRRPDHYFGELRNIDGLTVEYERIALPLTRAGKDVDIILSGFNFDPPVWRD